MTEGKKTKRVVDWEAIERDYRAGIKTLRQMADENGITHGAINKRSKAEGWSRDLKAKIVAAVEEKVSKAAVSSLVSMETKVSEKAIVEANAEVIAQADLINRADVLLALSVSRSQLQEVAALGNPEFIAGLEWLGKVMDESGVDDAGKQVMDRANELYRYIIGLAGRVKLSKEIAASHGVYIPMQRKILKLDEEADKNQSQLDALLAKINASA
jgi:hypothetical protein